MSENLLTGDKKKPSKKRFSSTEIVQLEAGSESKMVKTIEGKA
jgi:hypothetical protein